MPLPAPERIAKARLQAEPRVRGALVEVVSTRGVMSMTAA